MGWFLSGKVRAEAFCCLDGSCFAATCQAAPGLSFATGLGQCHGSFPLCKPAPASCSPLFPSHQSWQAERETNPWLPGRTCCLYAELLLPCSKVAKKTAAYLLQPVPGQEPPFFCPPARLSSHQSTAPPISKLNSLLLALPRCS